MKKKPGESPTSLAPWQRLARPTGLVLSPVLIAQGRALRSGKPRLPNAPTPWSGRIDGPDPLNVIGLGDSTIAGVGVSDAMQGLVAHLARGLYRRTSRGVVWSSFGQRGARTSDVVSNYLPAALEQTTPADVILVSVGANDAIRLTSTGVVTREMSTLLTTLQEHHPGAVILVSSLPAFHLFTDIPHPLRWVMSGHAKTLEHKLRPLVESLPRALMSPPPPRYPAGFFASDGFHPSAEGYQRWAEFALRDAESRGGLDHLMGR